VGEGGEKDCSPVLPGGGGKGETVKSPSSAHDFSFVTRGKKEQSLIRPQCAKEIAVLSPNAREGGKGSPLKP